MTSDVDITVRYAAAGRRPVLLAFQTAPDRDPAGAPLGVTVPTVLGETAHLTLPRDDYLISALVLEPPAELGGKPVLHGVGWIRHWVASSGTDRLAIATEAPTQELLEKLGLRLADGTSPFEIAPPGAAPRQLPGAATTAARLAANANRFTLPGPVSSRPQCRATMVSRFGTRCASGTTLLSRNGLCMSHDNALKRGEAVYDWSTRQQIR